LFDLYQTGLVANCVVISDLCKHCYHRCAFDIVDNHSWVIEKCAGCYVVYDLCLSPPSAEYLFVRSTGDDTGQIDDTAPGSHKRKVDDASPVAKGKVKKKQTINKRECNLILSVWCKTQSKLADVHLLWTQAMIEIQVNNVCCYLFYLTPLYLIYFRRLVNITLYRGWS
jgi:hypothetical protein